MHGTWIPTDSDRNAQGFIKLPHERAAADLIPPPPAAPVPESPAETEAADGPPARRWRWPSVATNRAILGGAAGLIVAGLLIALISRSAPAAPAARPVPSPAAPTVAPPSPAPSPTAPPVAAFWAPGDERVPGDVARSAIQRPVARYGETWVSVALDGGGEVWIARSDAEISDAELRALRDLAPQPTPLPPRVVERQVQVEVTPRCETEADIKFTADLNVQNGAGVPIGTVQGRSCYSQADADANAQAQADAMLNAWRQK